MKNSILFLFICICLSLKSQSAGNDGIIHRDTGYFDVVCTSKLNGVSTGINIDTNIISKDKIQAVFGNQIFVEPSTGIILTAPNGIRWFLTISNFGEINIRKAN